jgi:hypothetical protein
MPAWEMEGTGLPWRSLCDPYDWGPHLGPSCCLQRTQPRWVAKERKAAIETTLANAGLGKKVCVGMRMGGRHTRGEAYHPGRWTYGRVATLGCFRPHPVVVVWGAWAVESRACLSDFEGVWS